MTDWTRSPFEPDIAKVRRIPEIEAMLEEVCAMTGMGFAAVARVTDSYWVACQVLDRIDFGMDAGDELDIKTTICDEIRQTGEAVVIDRVIDDPRWRTHPIPTLYGFKSYISLPIVHEGGFFGTICAIDPESSKVPLDTILPRMQAIAAEIAGRLSPAA